MTSANFFEYIPSGEDAYTSRIDGESLIMIVKQIEGLLGKEDSSTISDYTFDICPSDDNCYMLVTLFGKRSNNNDYYIEIEKSSGEIIAILKANKSGINFIIEKAFVIERCRRQGIFTELLNIAIKTAGTAVEPEQPVFVYEEPRSSCELLMSDAEIERMDMDAQSEINKEVMRHVKNICG